jgi:hypothetical protein
LKPSGNTPTSSPAASSAAARQLAQPGHLVDQVSAEQPQVAVRGMVGVQARLQHDRVHREDPRVVRDDERGPGERHLVQAAHPDPEPLPVERQRDGHEDGRVEFGVEPELIDLILAGQPPGREVGHVGQPVPPGSRQPWSYFLFRR